MDSVYRWVGRALIAVCAVALLSMVGGYFFRAGVNHEPAVVIQPAPPEVRTVVVNDVYRQSWWGRWHHLNAEETAEYLADVKAAAGN